jgi:hypothetical protein
VAFATVFQLILALLLVIEVVERPAGSPQRGGAVRVKLALLISKKILPIGN